MRLAEPPEPFDWLRSARRAGRPVQPSAPRSVRSRWSTVKHHVANARSKVGATTTAQLVWILAPRLPEPEEMVEPDE